MDDPTRHPPAAERQNDAPAAAPGQRPRTGLILTGGGARAAYQVGVLKAIAELADYGRDNPFPIICGTSAGAINAASIACLADNFGKAVAILTEVWRNMRAGDIYRADTLGMSLSGVRWVSMLVLGWLFRNPPISLLDNTPLRALLTHHLDLKGIERSLVKGALHALCISASGYETGENISFFQANPDARPWRRVHRLGIRAQIGIDHLLASSAIPFVFPATRIHREYFGDGSMRQLAPISPAIHLGADQVLIVGTSSNNERHERRRVDGHPSLAQIAGHALSSIFLDGLAVDIERIQRINKTLAVVPPARLAETEYPLRPIRTLVISPSEPLDQIAARHADALPWSVKAVLRGVGAMNRNGGALTSYLLFEKPYTQALIGLGHADTMARAAEVRDFLQL